MTKILGRILDSFGVKERKEHSKEEGNRQAALSTVQRKRLLVEDLLAQESFRKALALDDSDGRLNTAEYLLGEHSAFLDLAET